MMINEKKKWKGWNKVDATMTSAAPTSTSASPMSTRKRGLVVSAAKGSVRVPFRQSPHHKHSHHHRHSFILLWRLNRCHRYRFKPLREASCGGL